MTDRVLIRVEDLNKSFKVKNDTLHVLKGINEVIHEGEVVSIRETPVLSAKQAEGMVVAGDGLKWLLFSTGAGS